VRKRSGELERRRDGLAGAGAAQAKAEHALAEARARQAQLQAEQARLAEVEGQRKRVAERTAELSGAASAQQAAEEAADAAKRGLAAAKEHALALRDADRQAASAAAACDRAATDVQRAERARDELADLLRRWEEACTELAGAAASHLGAQDAHEEATRAWSDASRRFYAGQAGLIARELQPGEACPVCGSHEHPHPAAFDGAVPTHEELKALEDARNEAEGVLAAASAEVAALRGALDERAAGIAAFAQNHPELPVPDGIGSTSEDATSLLARALEEQLASRGGHLTAALEEAQAALDAANARVAESAAAQECEELAARRADKASRELEAAAGCTATATAELAAASARLDALVAQGPVPDADALAAQLDEVASRLAQAEEELDDAGRGVSELEAVIKELGQTRELGERLEREQPALDARVAELASALERDRSRLDTLRETLPYPTRDQAAEAERGARDTAHDLRAAAESSKAALEEHRERLRGVEARTAALRAELAANDYPDPAEAARKLDEARLRRDELERARAAVFSRIQANRKVLAQLRANERAAGRVDEQYGELESLANTANGRLAGKEHISFETYVQTAYFDRMLAAANRRLDVMTSGRYALVRRATGTTQRGQTGLDLDVLDNYTGRAREASSLSGGESFKASLALALGLSDVAQAHAGGIQIDAMFIDEGFGSLDQESLQLAIKTLTELSGTGRLVGIISHVEELKESIDRKIVVERGREGSTLRVEV
jgi:exonuclease SbcC